MSSAEKQDMLKPILIGGVAMGVTSSIPGLSCLNMCCCLLGLAGGGLASYLYFKEQSNLTPPPYGTAAILGLGAGAVRAALDQLDVVVAERPEEPFRPCDGPGVVERLE